MADLIAWKDERMHSNCCDYRDNLAAIIRPRKKESTTSHNRYFCTNDLLDECVLLTLCNIAEKNDKKEVQSIK